MQIQFPRKLGFLFRPSPYKIAYGGREGTKSWGYAAALTELASARPLRILCVRETQTSIAASVHQLLKDTIKRLNVGPLFDAQQSTILGRNWYNAKTGQRCGQDDTDAAHTEFIFAGLKHNVQNIKSLEGADIVWVEEAQTVSKGSWDTLLPTIRKQGAEVWVTFNPDLATDDTYKRWVLNPPPGAIVVKIGYEDNRWLSDISKARIEHMRETSPKDFAHIYGGECRSEVEGAIFGAELKLALDQGRIGAVPYNKTKPVSTIWDLGFGDPTAIWFVQAYDGWFNFIDYLEANDETTADYVIKLNNKAYVYDTDWLPHDGVDTIIHRRLNGTGDRKKSIEMLLREARRNVRIVPKLLITDQINSARLFLNQCRFDADKCADGLQALRHYQWDTREAKSAEIDPREGRANENVRKGKVPLHNWASHSSSAFMGASIAMKQPQRPEAEKPKTPLTPPRLPGAYSPFG